MPSYPSGLRFERIVVPTPYAVGPANVYVFPTAPITLFDCGPNTPAAEAALLLGLESNGLQPEQIGRVVVSHGHPDHYGMVPRLQELSGAEILIGEHDLPKLREGSMLVDMGRLLLRAGMPTEDVVDMGEREKALGDLRPRVEGASGLRGGERLHFDGFFLDVLHVPGHSAGHICLYQPQDGVLFSGDTLLLEISPNPLLEPDPLDRTERRRSLVDYLATLERLSGMELTVVHPGHGDPIEDPATVIEDMRSHHRKRAEALARLLTARGKSGWELANELFPDLKGFANFLAVSEVVAHLDLLVGDGRAEEMGESGVALYRRGTES